VNAPILRIARLVAALFAALLIATTIIQFVQAPNLRARPDNRRTLLDNFSRERGSIILEDQSIAVSTPVDDEMKFLRQYPQALPYSHVTGYYSYLVGAGGGLEGAEDGLLSGSSDSLFYRRVTDLLTGGQPTGASLVVTVNRKAQEAAGKALGNQRGAVVALNPKTGAILAMVSHPEYDPNSLASHDIKAVEASWAALRTDPNRPLDNRAISGFLYPPGSVFKIVTASAALSNQIVTETTPIPAPGTMDLPETSAGLPNYDLKACGPNNETTLQRALEISCNTAFGWLGLKMGDAALREQAAKFGFGESLSIPMRVTPSTVPPELSRAQTAQSAVGQYDVRVTPLQVAMVSAAIANKGAVMRPYIVAQTLASNLDVIDQTQPQQLSQAVSPEIASTLTRMLVATVDSGTGTPAKISGVRVAGKTGTAQQGEGRAPHAWFTAFAPADDPQVAVAVVVEDGGNAGSEAAGGRLAGPIAKAVMEAVIKR
jgi:peptidoglycan glycosyltransferase